MSPALNIISTNLQGYGPPETISLPCFGVSGRAISISPCPGSKFKSFQAKVISAKCSFKHASFVCKAGSGGQRRNPDFRHNRNIFSRSRNKYNEEKDNSENLDESEFVSTKNGPILSLSNNSKPNATAAPGERERDIVELFRKVQAKLRERAAVKEENKFGAIEVQNKESETVDSLLNLLRKHSAEQGQRKVNGGNGSEFSVDRTRPNAKPVGDKNKRFTRPKSVVKEEPQETHRPSVGRPVSNFRRRSPVPRVKYEPIVSSEDTYDSLTQTELDVNMNGTHYEPVADYESDSDLESEIDITSGLELEEEEEEEEEDDEELEEPEVELDPENEFVDETATSKLLKADDLDVEEVVNDEKDTGKQRIELNDWNSMKIVELKALAKARGMKGFSKLKKSELVGLLSDDS
ncbi:rho-N domain-containing protein 1, chloroplastic-like [Silene latifolia]|uniref:rho-N domain-containing protein 1, chloroplastic-like n=1 Tax=Silene latifolia TaxID=37657 RepID=UPI003D77832A